MGTPGLARAPATGACTQRPQIRTSLIEEPRGPPSPGLKVVPWGQICKPGECHAILDPTEEGDADEVKGTDSMYEFAGINPNITEGELFTKCFPCHCSACRSPSSVSVEYDACPNHSQTGGWQRDASRGCKACDASCFARRCARAA